MNKISIALKAAILPLAVLALPTQISHAADGVALTDEGLELTVTANRREQKNVNTLAPVSIITRNDIERIQAQDIVDVLRLQNGVDIFRNGSAGTTTSVFLRGSNSKQVLVLIDGVRVSSATNGSFDWAGLPLTQVEKIEIVQGELEVVIDSTDNKVGVKNSVCSFKDLLQELADLLKQLKDVFVRGQKLNISKDEGGRKGGYRGERSEKREDRDNRGNREGGNRSDRADKRPKKRNKPEGAKRDFSDKPKLRKPRD